MANPSHVNPHRVARPGPSLEVLALVTALFSTAMGANAFVQFLVGYLTDIGGWTSGQAAQVLILAFGGMPLYRLSYAWLENKFGDFNLLLLGHVLFVVFLGLLIWGRREWIIVPAALALGLAGALVFTAGPLRILAVTPIEQRGAVSGLFFASNFLAWFVAVTIQGQVVRLYGLGPTAYLALVPSVLGLIMLLPLSRRRLKGHAITAADFLAPLRNSRYLLVMGFMALSAVAFGLMFGTLAETITATFGVGFASFMLSSFYLARLPGSLFAGLMIKRWGERRLLAVAFGLAGLLLLAVAAANTTFAIVLSAIVVLGFQQATVPVASMALVGSADTSGARQAGFGLLFAASEVGVAFALAVSQGAIALLDHGSVVYLLFGTLYVMGSLAAWHSPFRARE